MLSMKLVVKLTAGKHRLQVEAVMTDEYYNIGIFAIAVITF